MIAGRRHERLQQLHHGVPVFGGELVRQTDSTATLTVFGTLYEGIDVDVTPSLGPRDAERIVERRGGFLFGSEAGPELVVLPRDEGGYALAYRVRFSLLQPLDVRVLFIDAHSGRALLEFSDLKRQTVGNATGVLGDRKKISTRQSGAVYVADDKLRPPVISTYDFHGDVRRLVDFLNVGPTNLGPADLASDADNDWSDGADVDAHVYAGYVYDYYFKRHGRRGLDNANIPIRSVVHPIRRELWTFYDAEIVTFFFTNASYLGDGVMFYGDGLPPGVVSPFDGKRWNYLAGALDVVAHELTHGVTDYSSRLNYRDESGALNEAFSDIMGTSVEFYVRLAEKGGRTPNYILGDDVIAPGGIRSMQNPVSYGDPDHYSLLYRGPLDNGGVHTNSGIANYVFYLAIEGGTNRVSGVTVQGVGAANREQMERVFYRAFTSALVPSSNFSQARTATIQAARELYNPGSPAEQAVTQAWNAVGVN
jgi:thermolysin